MGYRRGTGIVDLTAAERAGDLAADGAFQTGSLNAFLALGRPRWRALTARAESLPPAVAVADAELVLPFEVADYVDFYSSEHHAANVGRILGRASRRYRSTGGTCRSGTTGGPARWWSPVPT